MFIVERYWFIQEIVRFDLWNCNACDASIHVLQRWTWLSAQTHNDYSWQLSWFCLTLATRKKDILVALHPQPKRKKSAQQFTKVHRARICFSLRRDRWFSLREWCLESWMDIWHDMSGWMILFLEKWWTYGDIRIGSTAKIIWREMSFLNN